MIDQGLRQRVGDREHFNYGGDYGEKVHDAQFCINVGINSDNSVSSTTLFKLSIVLLFILGPLFS